MNNLICHRCKLPTDSLESGLCLHCSTDDNYQRILQSKNKLQEIQMSVYNGNELSQSEHSRLADMLWERQKGKG